MEMYEIVSKLIGPVTAVGDSCFDRDRLANLKKLISLTELLLDDISEAARDRDRHEASMKQIGERAAAFLEEIHSESRIK